MLVYIRCDYDRCIQNALVNAIEKTVSYGSLPFEFSVHVDIVFDWLEPLEVWIFEAIIYF